jgi:hypothetical protein
METFMASITHPGQAPAPGARLVSFTGPDTHSIRSRSSRALLDQAAAYAAAQHVFLVPGLYRQGEWLCLCLLDDNGEIVLEQPAAHLNRSWAGDLRRADILQVLQTPLGVIALCVDVDIYKSEVGRILALQGAEIVVSCQFLQREDFRREMILAGAWQQAQQNCLYILNSSNLHGCILGPCETALDRSGFLTEIATECPIQAQLSAEKRAAAYEQFPIFKSLNPGLYQRHAEELWK